jgi:hypothetical protein
MGVGKRDLEGWACGKKMFLGELKRGWVLVGKLKKMVGGLQGLGGESQPNFVSQGRLSKWQGYWGL